MESVSNPAYGPKFRKNGVVAWIIVNRQSTRFGFTDVPFFIEAVVLVVFGTIVLSLFFLLTSEVSRFSIAAVLLAVVLGWHLFAFFLACIVIGALTF